MKEARAGRGLVVTVAALATGAVVLRFLTLDLQSFGHDESVTVTRVLFPGLGETLDAVLRSERSGPVYYVLAWGWTTVFGTGEIGIRSLSAVCGGLTVPVVYLTAAELASRRAGLIAAVLVALNPFLFWYSQEARAYALFVLLSALALLFFARSLGGGGERTRAGSLAWWVTWSALSLATHYFALFLIAPQAVWLLWTRRDRRAWLAVGAIVAVGLALLPIALHQQQQREVGGISGRPLAARVLETGVMFTGGGEPQLGPTVGDVGRTSLILATIVAGLALLALALLLRGGAPAERRGGLVAGGVGLFALAVPVALALAGVDLFKHRNLIAALVPLIVAVAIGFGTRRSGWLGLGSATLLAAVFAVGLAGQLSSEELQRRDVRAAAKALGPAPGPRLVLGPNGDDDPLLHYLGSNGGYKLDNVRKTLVVQEIGVVSVEPLAMTVPVPGFELVGRSIGPTYRVYEYRAPEPRPVRLADLPAEQLVGEPYTAIVNAASGPG